jgi:hypothetical protein
MTSPSTFQTGPPELPPATVASICTISVQYPHTVLAKPFSCARPRPLIMPEEADPLRVKGLPTTRTGWPTERSDESARGSVATVMA